MALLARLARKAARASDHKEKEDRSEDKFEIQARIHFDPANG